MKTLIAILILSIPIMVQAKSSAEVELIFSEAMSNFKYLAEKPGKNHQITYTRIDRTFYGDCEDLAFTFSSAVFKFLKKQSVVYAVDFGEGRGNNRYHAITVVDGYVYDFVYKRRVKKDDYPAKFLGRLSFQGEIKKNDWYWQKDRPEFKF